MRERVHTRSSLIKISSDELKNDMMKKILIQGLINLFKLKIFKREKINRDTFRSCKY
jgi:hypothetical protein